MKVISALYDQASSTVLLDGQIGEKFKTSVGVRQGCLLSPVLFNLFLETIMLEALEDYQPSVSIGGRDICNLRFADDIDLMGDSEESLQDLTGRLERAASGYGMEISAEKSKILINGSNTVDSITMYGETLEQVTSFKYLGSMITSDGTSDREVQSRINAATSCMARLKSIWKSKDITVKTKIRLYKALVLSILTYGCESWTLRVDQERRIHAFDMKSLRRILGIPWHAYKTNEYVMKLATDLSGPIEPVIIIIKRRKLQWFGHVVRHQSLAKTILQGWVSGSRRVGGQKKMWWDNIQDWTGIPVGAAMRVAECRKQWRVILRTSAKLPNASSGEARECE